MSSYLGRSPVRTPQSRGLAGQVPNRAGGFAWEISIWDRLHRFLVLGTEGGTYYVGQADLTLDNIEALAACVDEDGLRTVKLVGHISQEGRAPKNDPAIFALAYASVKGDDDTRAAAYSLLPKVCRIGTHLFMFLEFREKFGGWSRGLRTAVANWYLDKEPDQLAYQLVKYRQRGGWTHHDALLLAHAKPETPTQDELFNFVKPQEDHDGNVRPWSRRKSKKNKLPDAVRGFKRAQKATRPGELVTVLEQFPQLPWEALNPDHLKSPAVWKKMIDNHMPMTALIRNLAKLTTIGVLEPVGKYTDIVANQITDAVELQRAKVHPLAVLFALATYREGKGFRGSGEWDPVAKIVDALDSAFYSAFGNVQPTGKRVMLAIDVSGSMGGHNMHWEGHRYSFYGGAKIANSQLDCMDGAIAMAMVTERTEDNVAVCAFDTGIKPLSISSRQRLDDIVAGLPRNGGGTDCALPMLWAAEHSYAFDTFVVYTDNETWHGVVHPAEALKEYRRASGIDAKLVVCGMTADEFSIADPNDPGMMDVVGFDAATPSVIADFSTGTRPQG